MRLMFVLWVALVEERRRLVASVGRAAECERLARSSSRQPSHDARHGQKAKNEHLEKNEFGSLITFRRQSQLTNVAGERNSSSLPGRRRS
mmetsp:Transcript_2505/g.7349  ORF Transcript_2505/g.7349 Transcript_2505/m.7349 type:complete len:90 (+) Transcript_2505:2594-2863(+)